MLPIEAFYLGPEEAGCAAMTSLASREGVTLRDLLSGQPTLRDEPGFGYAAKPLALAASRFAEALLLDADNFALADPTRLFESLTDDPQVRMALELAADAKRYEGILRPPPTDAEAPGEAKAVQLKLARAMDVEPPGAIFPRVREDVALPWRPAPLGSAM